MVRLLLKDIRLLLVEAEEVYLQVLLHLVLEQVVLVAVMAGLMGLVIMEALEVLGAALLMVIVEALEYLDRVIVVVIILAAVVVVEVAVKPLKVLMAVVQAQVVLVLLGMDMVLSQVEAEVVLPIPVLMGALAVEAEVVKLLLDQMVVLE